MRGCGIFGSVVVVGLLLAAPAAAEGGGLGLTQVPARGAGNVVPDYLGRGLDAPRPAPAPRRPRAQAPPLVDRDADGALSRDDFRRAYPTRPWLFRMFDTDQDGRVSPAERARGRALLAPDQAG